jgi:ACS family hexuronate transporter-like MFS transporter
MYQPANTLVESIAPGQRSAGWEWLLCGVLLSATLLNYANRQTVPTAAERIKQELGLNNEQYGRVEGNFGLAFAFGALIFGAAADLAPVRWLYPIVLVVWSAAAVVSGRVETYAGLAASRTVLGLFEAGHWPCALRTTQRVFPPARRTLANALLQAGTPVGAILPPVLMLLLATDEPGSWRPMFWIIGVLGLPWAIAWLVAVRSSDLERPALQTATTMAASVGGAAEAAAFQERPLLSVFLSRRFALLVVGVIGINTTWHYIRVWMPLALREDLHYTSNQVQWVMIGYWTATFFGSLASGFLTERLARIGWGVHRARMTAFLGFALITALTVVAARLPAGATFIVLMLLVGFGSLGQFPIYYSLSQELSARHQGKVGGTLGFLAWAVMYFVHPAVGRLLDTSPGSRPYIFASIGLLPLAAWGVIAVGWGRRGPRP